MFLKVDFFLFCVQKRQVKSLVINILAKKKESVLRKNKSINLNFHLVFQTNIHQLARLFNTSRI